MKHYPIRLLAAGTLLTAVVLGACTHPVAPREADIPAGKGVVRVAAAVEGPGGARTVMPSAAEGFSRYEYWFAKDGADAAEAIPAEGVFELDPGDYTVTVKAFAPEGTEAAAAGTSAAFAIAAGADAGSVTVTLVPVVAAGQGTLAFTLSYPKDATLESFTLTRLAGVETIDLGSLGNRLTTPGGRTFFGEEAGIDAGYWLARATLKKGLAYTGKTEVAHIYQGAVTSFNWAFDDGHFTGIPVTSSADSGPGTLRSALAYAMEREGGVIFIDLPDDDKVITLTSPLPPIGFKTITIEGGGATLTQRGFTPTLLTLPAPDTNLLAITSTEAVVTIRRLHFTGGRVKGYGGAIYNEGYLALESCIFSDNRQLQPTHTNPDAGDDGQAGGAVFSSGPVTVRGCTFYTNIGGVSGSAIRMIHSTVSQAGNLFFGNGPYEVSLYDSSGTDLGYNVYSTTLPIGPASFKPIKDGPAATALTALPGEYPAVDFYGVSIAAGGAAGAVQTRTVNTICLDYSVNDSERGVISSQIPAPDADGLYPFGTTVTLTAAAVDRPGVTFSHWTVDGTDSAADTITITMNTHKSAQAKFGRVVSDPGDTGGSFEAPTLRYALTNAVDNDVIILPAGGTISLTETLPEIVLNTTIVGNGATLTCDAFYTPSSTSQLLRIVGIAGNIPAVKISRLHFTGAQANINGGAITNNAHLTLESCIFSENQVTGSTGRGGAIYTTSITLNTASLTVRGCTFYSNSATTQGGAIYRQGGTVTLTGNLFSGNAYTASGIGTGGHVVYGTVTSGGYNVSDKAAGTTATTGSGYADSGTGDKFSVTDIVFATGGDPATTPSSSALGAGGLQILTSLPADFPATYFDGTDRDLPATAGAVLSD